jgi:hypothetical protein
VIGRDQIVIVPGNDISAVIAVVTKCLAGATFRVYYGGDVGGGGNLCAHGAGPFWPLAGPMVSGLQAPCRFACRPLEIAEPRRAPTLGFSHCWGWDDFGTVARVLLIFEGRTGFGGSIYQAAASRFCFTLLQVFPVFVVAPIVAQSPRKNNRRDEIF